MKILKLDSAADGFNDAIATLRQTGNRVIRRRDCAWTAVPDDHGLTAPLVMAEYTDPQTARDAGCPPPLCRFGA